MNKLLVVIWDDGTLEVHGDSLDTKIELFDVDEKVGILEQELDDDDGVRSMVADGGKTPVTIVTKELKELLRTQYTHRLL